MKTPHQRIRDWADRHGWHDLVVRLNAEGAPTIITFEDESAALNIEPGEVLTWDDETLDTQLTGLVQLRRERKAKGIP